MPGSSDSTLFQHSCALICADHLLEGDSALAMPGNPVPQHRLLKIEKQCGDLCNTGGFRLGKKAVLDALKASLQRLGVQKVDLYQVGG